MSFSISKKKKKRSFLQIAKKYGKQGSYGKGKQLSEEEYNYYIRVFEQLKQVDDEEKDTLVNNFFCELSKENNIKSAATNQIVSRILDDTLPLAAIHHVENLMKVLSEDLRVVSIDPYASHVLQTLLNLSLKYIQTDAVQKNFNEEHEVELIPINEQQKDNFKQFIIKVSKFVFNNLHEFVSETYASHIVRTILEVCSGAQVSNSVRSSRKAQSSYSAREDLKQILFVPPEILALVSDYMTRLTQLPNFTDVITNDCGSAVLQTALLVLIYLGDNDKTSALVDFTLEHGFKKLESYPSESENDIHSLFESNAVTRLLEVVLSSASQKQQDIVFNLYFRDHVSDIIKHKIGNFTVQRFLSSWKTKESFLVLYDPTSEHLEGAFDVGNTGVIFALVQACRRLNSHQSRCVKRLMKLFGCYESEANQLKLPVLLLYFLHLEDYEERKESNTLTSLSLHGTLILQELLNFNKPIKMVNGLLEMSAGEFLKMTCDPRGSHVTDAFTTSPFIGEASRGKFISKLEGQLVSLACNKHGSRSLEALWKDVGVKFRTKICQELFDSSSRLKENHFGTIIYNNFQIRFFNKNEKNDWEELQQKDFKKRQLLHELLEEAGDITEASKKKKKKHS